MTRSNRPGRGRSRRRRPGQPPGAAPPAVDQPVSSAAGQRLAASAVIQRPAPDPTLVTAERGSAGSRTRWKALGLAVCCLALYLANARSLPFERGGDTIPARLLPFSWLAYGTTTLDPFAEEFAQRGGVRWWVQDRQGHLISLYPVGPSVAALPVYLPALAALAATGRLDAAHAFEIGRYLEPPAAALQAAITVLVLYLALLQLVSSRVAWWTAFGFGMGTSMWATASQLLWQHGTVACGLTLAFWLLLRSPVDLTTRRCLLAAGAALSLSIAARPTAGLFSIAIGFTLLLARTSLANGASASAAWLERLRRVVWFGLGHLPLTALVVAYNLLWYGSPVGGYAILERVFDWRRMAIAGSALLVSPNRGLLVFTPIALLGLIGLARAVRHWRRDRIDLLLALCGIAATAHFLLIAAYREWHGGWSFGPRYMVDILPILALAGGRELAGLGRLGRSIAAVALAWSLLMQWNGAFCFPASNWNARMNVELERAAWSTAHWQPWEDFVQWRDWPFWSAPL